MVLNFWETKSNFTYSFIFVWTDRSLSKVSYSLYASSDCILITLRWLHTRDLLYRLPVFVSIRAWEDGMNLQLCFSITVFHGCRSWSGGIVGFSINHCLRGHYFWLTASNQLIHFTKDKDGSTERKYPFVCISFYFISDSLTPLNAVKRSSDYTFFFPSKSGSCFYCLSAIRTSAVMIENAFLVVLKTVTPLNRSVQYLLS